MKKIILSALLLISSNAFASETLKGKFEIDNVSYELTYTYDIPFNQTVSSQKVRIFDDVRLPEQTEPMPAYCMFEMTFPANVKVTMKNLATEKIVYTRHSFEYLGVSAYGGLVEAQQCEWNVSQWKEKVSGMMRVTETAFSLNGKSYRYFMDTNIKVDAYGTSDDLVVARSTTPLKGSDGKRDGEIWIDTQPTPDGNYQRVWAPLSL